ncbi:hypothetical protein B0H12DRAFT_1078334 [Mycena haematopus]|nr:hypothetical protein B0H12DRAFT_1078334 [Mycena haematopus]
MGVWAIAARGGQSFSTVVSQNRELRVESKGARALIALTSSSSPPSATFFLKPVLPPALAALCLLNQSLGFTDDSLVPRSMARDNRWTPNRAEGNGRVNAAERSSAGSPFIGPFRLRNRLLVLNPPERMFHLELKRRGAWRGRVLCPRCHKRHQEKFDARRCGGEAGVMNIGDALLSSKGWKWKKIVMRRK